MAHIPEVRIEQRPEGRVFVLYNSRGVPDPVVPESVVLALVVRLHNAQNEAMAADRKLREKGTV